MTDDQGSVRSPISHRLFGHLLVIDAWSFLIGALVIAIAVVMTAWTWFGWNDPVVDFGRELYVPWQIVKGRLLYRDIAYFNGPFSPYFNALLFAIFGASIRTIAIANLVLLAGMTCAIWQLWKQISDRFAATAACVTLLCVFAFLQLVPTGNYNFITPYSHEVTHGIILSFFSILFLANFLKSPRPWRLWMSGLMLGLVFLTKPEIFSAAASGVGLGAILGAMSAGIPRPQRIHSISGFLIAVWLPAVTAFCLFLTKMPAREAFHAVMGAWAYIGDRRLWDIPLYQRTMGTLDSGESILVIVKATVVYGLILAVAVMAGMWTGGFQSSRSRSLRIAAIVFLGTVLAGGILFYVIDLGIWQQAIRGLTIVIPLIAAAAVINASRHGRRNPRNILFATVAVFAAVLLARIFLNVRTYHYGFGLAMPATLLVVAMALHALPAMVNRRGGDGLATRSVIAGVIAIFIFAHLYVFERSYSNKTTRVIGEFGSFLADPVPKEGAARDHRGRTENALLEVLRGLPAKATLACIPEGAMINVQARRNNSTAYVSLLPPELIMFGEDRVLADFQAHPPDYILMTEASSEDYGPDVLDQYARRIRSWIEENYTPLLPPAVPVGMPPILLQYKPLPSRQVR